ncbi:hypothetical protein [Pseudomonas fluorescens]|uniref:hypothetical protein n=1 Tax=Pseudomonas fluorescens TaxID=294 RepID=UPI0030DC03ED
MSANDLPENSTLTLKELDIPGRTGPISEEPEIWGINRAAAHDNFPRQGLLCRAGPWDVMSIGDALDIKIEGQQVEKKIVKEHEVGTELQMFVPAARLHEGPLTVSYTVTRLNQTPENSEVSRYLFKDTRPGGHDEDDGPGHSKLIMSIPPEIISGGIDKDNVADGFLITIGKADGLPPYPFAAAGDRIQVSVGGVFVLNEGLTQDQADGKTAITIHIDEATLREAGDSDSKGLAVVFEVYDLVDNRSEDWSFEQRVVVAIDTTLLDAPLLEEAVNNVLDVDKLGTADGTAQIVALDPSKFKVGDIIILRIKGTPVEGAPIDIEIKSEPLVSVPSIVNISVPNAVLGQFAKTQFALSFWLPSADGSPELRSKTQFISAIGEVQRLAAPVVRDALDGALDPTLEQVVFLIPFDESFVAGDSIELHCLIIRSDLTPYLLKLPLRTITNGDIAAKEPLQINASRDPLLDLAKGGTMEAYYLSHIASTVLGTMNRVNATHTTRESIHAEILQVGEPRLELPEPEVAGVVNGVMPPDRDGTTLTVSYLDTHPGDVVTYCWVGSKTGTVCDSITLNSFTAGKPIQFTIRAGLIKNNEGGMVEAKYSIKRAAGGTSHSNPLTFRVGVALELKAPAIEQAPNGSTLDPFAAEDALTAIIDYDMRIGDKITVTLTGAPGTPAGGSHTTAPVNVTTIGVQKIEIDTSVLAFNFGQSVTVSFIVSRDGESKDSQLLLLAVLPIKDHDHRLPSPIINGNTSSELDTNTLARGAKTRIARWSHNAQGQPLWLLYLKDDDPTPFAITYEATPTPAAGLPNGMYPDTPVAALKALPNGARVRIEFRVGFDHSPDESKAVTFPVRTYTIAIALELKAPAIEQAPNGSTLDPFAAEDALTAIIDYDMRIGDKITVTLTGAPGTPAGGSHTTAPVNVTTIGAQKIEIDTSVLAFNFGKSVSVHCTVSRDGESKDSEVLVLAVLPIQDQDSRLPSPIINGNTSSELDTNTLARGAKTRIARWSHNAQGQPLWLLYLKDDDPTPFAITYEATPTPAAGLPNGMYPDTPVAALKALPNGARVRIEFRVGFDRSSDESKAVTFPVRNYTVKAKVWVTPTLNNVLDDKGVEVPEGQATLSTTLKLKGTATKGEKVELYDGNGPSAALKGTADVDPVTGKWEYTITVAPAGSRRLYAKALYPVSQLYSNVRTLADGTRENFDELDDLDIPPSTSLEFRNFVLENTTNGIITIRKVSSPFPGQVERKTLSASGTGPFSLHLKSKGIKVSFWYTSLHKKEQVTVRFLGPRLNMFHFLDPYTWGKAEHFSFHAFEPATEISRIEIWMKRDGVMHFDNFQFSLP